MLKVKLAIRWQLHNYSDMNSFFRYPGGKAKLKSVVIKKLSQYYTDGVEYCEPFFGGGSVGLNFILSSNCKKVCLNDYDYGVACLWNSVIYYPEYLKEAVKLFEPSVEAFHSFKQDLLSGIKESMVSTGFKKLAIHQISYSGLGTKSGGPLGGKDQKSKYKIDCRWSPDYICKKIDKIHNMFKGVSIKFKAVMSEDFSTILESLDKSLTYLDPPYYVKGNDLYQHGFTHDDHLRLAESLRKHNNRWVLSYDDCPEIREIYSWANIEVIDVKYSITAKKDKSTGNRTSTSKPELLITNG